MCIAVNCCNGGCKPYLHTVNITCGISQYHFHYLIYFLCVSSKHSYPTNYKESLTFLFFSQPAISLSTVVKHCFNTICVCYRQVPNSSEFSWILNGDQRIGNEYNYVYSVPQPIYGPIEWCFWKHLKVEVHFSVTLCWLSKKNAMLIKAYLSIFKFHETIIVSFSILKLKKL